MKYSNKLLILITIVSLGLNLIIFTKLNTINDRINSLISQNSRLVSSVDSIPNQIDSAFNQIKQMERWVIPAEFELKELKEDKLYFKANWQIKEYDKDSKVYFNYKEGGEIDKIEAVDKGNGYFKADFSINLSSRIEPQWSIGINRSNSSSNSASVSQTSQAAVRKSGLEYYISVENKYKIKSSEFYNFNLDHLVDRVYGFLAANIDITENNIYNVSLRWNNTSDPVTKINTPRLKAFKDGKLVLNEDLSYREESHLKEKIYNIKLDDGKEFDRLVLEVKYDNGKEFTKEIYKK